MFEITTLIDMQNMVPLNSEGRNSSVYTFTDPQLGAEFIMKKIDKSSITNINELFNESKILYEVRHPNIMEIQYASYDDNNIFIVMPRCKNGSMQTLLNQRFLSVREILKYSLEFLTGLHYVHAHKLIHYDIKPTNILINNSGKAVLTDFGLAKYSDDLGLATQECTYISEIPPEKYLSSKTNLKCDIYQAGLTMYRMCNGNDIWKEQLEQVKDNLKDAILNGEFPNRKWYMPHIPLQLRKVINKCIEVNPDDRYNSVLEVINALSLIDNNLDWKYLKETDKESWARIGLNGKYYEVIEFKQKDNTFHIVGRKINNQSKKSSNVSKWAYSSTEKDAVVKKLVSFLKE